MLFLWCHFQEDLKSLGRQTAPSCPPATPFLITQNDSVQKGIFSKSRCWSPAASQLTALHHGFASELTKLSALVNVFYFFQSYCVVFLEDFSWQFILTVQPIALHVIRSFSCYSLPISLFAFPFSIPR